MIPALNPERLSMFLIDPHIHMVSRTMADYETLALSGVRAVSEPAFWAGFDRSPAGFLDYFHQLTTFEPSRAAQFGIDHYCWICLNPKEAQDLGKAREVLAEIPQYLSRPTVLGIGEIGLNKNTPNEAQVFQQHVQLAIDCFKELRIKNQESRSPTAQANSSPEQKVSDFSLQTSALSCPSHHLILIHTPHLEDKLKGTRMILGLLRDFGSKLDHARILIDHVEEHTIKMVLDEGYWAGMTIYPVSKATPQRAVDMIEMYGAEKLMVNAAADWGISDPLNTHRTCLEARRRGHTLETLLKIFHNNPATFFGQSPNFKPKPIRMEQT
jgi:uncharacterized protein